MNIEDAVCTALLTIATGLLWLAWWIIPKLPAAAEAVTLYGRM